MDHHSTFPTKQDIIHAHDFIKPSIHHTPICTSSSIDQILGCNIFFKCENFQRVGAFKMRGTSYAIHGIDAEARDKGICTHSSGNHAQAVALAAKINGIAAHIVMPANAPTVKRAAVKGYGAHIYNSGSRIEDRENMVSEVLKKTGAHFIHPYNDYLVITGQATAAKELLEETEQLDVILAPVGGGGLISGTALTAKYFSTSTMVYGAEPKAVDDAYRSFHSGRIEKNATINTLADGLCTTLGDKTLSIIRAHVDDIYTVTELSIVEAMRLLWERMKMVVEPSAAVPLAAVMENVEMFKNLQVGIILSGGNVDLKNLPF